MALWGKDLSSMWLPQIPSCNFSRSSSNALGCMHSRYGPKKERLHSFWSSDSQNQGAFLRILSASDFSSGKISSFKNSTTWSIQLDPTLTWWTWTTSLLTFIGLHKSSTRMTRGNLRVKVVVSVARESACVFPLLGMCNRLKYSNPNCKCLTWLKYHCILSSIASKSPFTWPMTNLESENISTTFPPILWTMDIPSNKVSYSALLFVVEKYNLNDFSMVIF